MVRPELMAALNPVRTPLQNGAVLISKETRSTPSVAINLGVRAGSACDPDGAPGTVWLLSRVIDRGTSTRSAADIAEELDSRGITLSVNVTRHLFSLVCTCLADDFQPVMALIGEIVRSPSIPDDEIAIRKREIVTSIRQDADNPAVRASEGLMARLYPDGHPYGRPTKGTIDDVEALTRDHLVQVHNSRFAPTELTTIIVGDVSSTLAYETVTQVFGDWRQPSPSPIAVPTARPASERTRLVMPMMNKAQADIAYGFVTIRRQDPEYHAFWLMNNAFGQFALGGRLGQRIRERQGMAYYVSSSFDANVAEGPLTIRAGVSPANVDRAVASIDDEVTRLIRDGLTQKEVEESRRYLIGSIPRMLETNASIANVLQLEEFFELGLDYDARMPGLLGAVTLDEVNDCAKRFLDVDRATVVIAGPYTG
jgi:zinc protease